jgi:phosphoketolase
MNTNTLAFDATDLTAKTNTLTPELLHKMNSYWRAAVVLQLSNCA